MRTLAELEVGASGVVTDVSKRCQLRRRFFEIGLTPGTSVRCMMESPLGDPRAYYVRGAVFALRHDDARHVLLAAEAGEKEMPPEWAAVELGWPVGKQKPYYQLITNPISNLGNIQFYYCIYNLRISNTA